MTVSSQGLFEDSRNDLDSYEDYWSGKRFYVKLLFGR